MIALIMALSSAAAEDEAAGEKGTVVEAAALMGIPGVGAGSTP